MKAVRKFDTGLLEVLNGALLGLVVGLGVCLMGFILALVVTGV